jgi:hypothetical protein
MVFGSCLALLCAGRDAATRRGTREAPKRIDREDHITHMGYQALPVAGVDAVEAQRR